MTICPTAGGTRRPTTRRADRGFTLVELMIAIVLSGIIAGVIVAALATSLNVASSTTAQVNDSADAGLISSFLVRDAQSAGTVDPTTATRDPALGVSISSTTAGWGGCTQTGALVVRFSWVDRSTTASVVVVTYALDVANQLNRRVCTKGTTVDVLLGRHVSSAVASCLPIAACTGDPISVSLTVRGTGLRAPLAYTLTASLRTRAQPGATLGNSAQVALTALGAPGTTAACPNLSLAGTGVVTVLGNALVDSTCGTSPISGNQANVRPVGALGSVGGIVDPFRSRVAPVGICVAGGTNPSVIGASSAADAIVVYPQAVVIQASITFAPGRYIFCGGLSITSGTVTGSNVLLYLANGSLTIGAAATLDLDGRVAGSEAGLAVWVATAQSVVIDGGNHASTLAGLLYAPTSTVTLSSSLAANFGGVVVKSLTITGAGPMRFGLPLPVITVQPTTIPAAQVGIGYSTQLTSIGGTAPSTWSVTGLPAGIALNATTGSITGTPTTAGTYPLVVTTFDATAAAVSVDYTLVVVGRLAISSPSSLPSGQATIAYTATTITATGGSSPVTWSATGLPTGMSINPATGVITGTPGVAGTAAVVVTATDASAVTAQRSYSVTIAAAPQVGAVCPTTISGWRGEYFSNIGLVAPSTLCRDDAAINFDWGSGAAANGLPTDVFSVRWTKTQTFTAGTYSFALGSDDGARLYMDGALVLDRWVDQGYPNPQPTVDLALTAGSHTMMVEYYERGGLAAATLVITASTPAVCGLPATGWAGQYFSNISLSGFPTACRDDASIAFDWSDGSPIAGVSAENFSVRWTRTAPVAAGTYNFALGTDDGGRLYIDGVLVIDQWVDQSYPATPPNATRTLAGGSHTFIVEYYERSGSARATLVTTPVSNGVIVTPSLSGDRNYYGENRLTITNSAPITSMTMTITVAQTAGVSYQGLYTNFRGNTVTLSNSTSGGAVRYTVDLIGGRTIVAGSWLIVGQWSGTGTAHPTAGDVWTVTTTSGGIVSTISGTY